MDKNEDEMMSEPTKEVLDAMAAFQSGRLRMVYARPESDKGVVYCTFKEVPTEADIRVKINEIFANNADKVAQAREKPQLIGWFVGQAMKAVRGEADPQMVYQLCNEALSGEIPS